MNSVVVGVVGAVAEAVDAQVARGSARHHAGPGGHGDRRHDGRQRARTCPAPSAPASVGQLVAPALEHERRLGAIEPDDHRTLLRPVLPHRIRFRVYRPPFRRTRPWKSRPSGLGRARSGRRLRYALMTAPQVTVIGLDSATFDVIDPLLAQGELPNLGRLFERGSRGILRSTTHPLTPHAWTTMVTGVNAGRHGVWDFTERDESGYRLRVVNGSQRRAPALWDYLTAAGRRCRHRQHPVHLAGARGRRVRRRGARRVRPRRGHDVSAGAPGRAPEPVRAARCSTTRSRSTRATRSTSSSSAAPANRRSRSRSGSRSASSPSSSSSSSWPPTTSTTSAGRSGSRRARESRVADVYRSSTTRWEHSRRPWATGTCSSCPTTAAAPSTASSTSTPGWRRTATSRTPRAAQAPEGGDRPTRRPRALRASDQVPPRLRSAVGRRLRYHARADLRPEAILDRRLAADAGVRVRRLRERRHQPARPRT